MTTTTKERPFNCTAHEVISIREGRMTMFWRPVEPQPPCEGKMLTGLDGELMVDPRGRAVYCWPGIEGEKGEWSEYGAACPFGKPGDKLYVRESWCQKMDDGRFVWNAEGNLDPSCFYYRADGVEVSKDDGDGGTEYCRDGSEASPWVSAARMPREASRDTLELTDVRVERLQGITEQDARLSGVPTGDHYPLDKKWCTECRGEGLIGSVGDGLGLIEVDCWECDTPIKLYRNMWNSRYAKPKPVRSGGIITHYVSYPWEDVQEAREHRGKEWWVLGNPLVWRNVFRRVEG